MTSNETSHTTIDSPLGELLLAGGDDGLSRVHMRAAGRPRVDTRWTRDPEPFAEAIEQLGEYFAGERREFELDLAMHGDAFERRVWAALRGIPYGETVSYGEIARELGHPDAARAVGRANARNPVAVIVPCHRVVGADGSLTGYAGGLDNKRLLLELEAVHSPAPADRLFA